MQCLLVDQRPRSDKRLFLLETALETNDKNVLHNLNFTHTRNAIHIPLVRFYHGASSNFERNRRSLVLFTPLCFQLHV